LSGEIWRQGFDYVQEDARPVKRGESAESAFTQYVHEKIYLLKRRMASGRKIENTTGFLLKAIKENWANSAFADAQKRQVMEEQKKIRQQRQREIESLERRIAELEKARWAEICQRCKALVEECPELLAPVVEALLVEDVIFQKVYKPNMTPDENYRETMGIRPFMDTGLELRYADRFADIYDAHDPGIAEVKARLAELVRV
jgi:hypothetical protein